MKRKEKARGKARKGERYTGSCQGGWAGDSLLHAMESKAKKHFYAVHEAAVLPTNRLCLYFLPALQACFCSLALACFSTLFHSFSSLKKICWAHTQGTLIHCCTRLLKALQSSPQPSLLSVLSLLPQSQCLCCNFAPRREATARKLQSGPLHGSLSQGKVVRQY